MNGPAPLPIWKQLAAASAVALAFGPLALAGQSFRHPLLDTTASAYAYGERLSETLAQVTGNDAARFRAGGFVVELNKALAEPSDKTRVVDYPKPVSANMLRITAVVPPKGMETLPIPVCAEQNSKVLGVWNITAKGEVQPASWTGQRESEGNSAACKSFILTARNDINSKLAQAVPGGTPAQPPPVTTGALKSAAVAATNPAMALR